MPLFVDVCERICSFRGIACFSALPRFAQKPETSVPVAKKDRLTVLPKQKKSAQIWVFVSVPPWSCRRWNWKESFKESQKMWLNFLPSSLSLWCPFETFRWRERETRRTMLETLSTEMSSSPNVVEASQVETSTSEGSPERDDAVSSWSRVLSSMVKCHSKLLVQSSLYNRLSVLRASSALKPQLTGVCQLFYKLFLGNFLGPVALTCHNTVCKNV